MKYFFIYLQCINLIGFFAMFLDKQKAKRGKWRIPEKTLFLLALLGGSLGTTLGMHLCRHKTKKNLWRIPEKTLFLASLLGGSIGTLVGMHLFHHKTKHWYFKFGMPLIFIIQAILLFYFAT